MAELAARLGSDCPLFLETGPVYMRGRGEHITPAGATLSHRIRGTRVLLFKPAFGVDTAWAYRALSRDPGSYLPARDADALAESWETSDKINKDLLYNSLQRPVGDKFIALSCLLDEIGNGFNLPVLLSGSGSCVYVLAPNGEPFDPLMTYLRTVLGESAFIVETCLA